MPNTAAVVREQLADFVDLALARRLELAETITPECFAALHRYNPSDPCELLQVAGACAFFGGVTYPANQTVGLGMYGEVTPHDLDQVEDFFRSRGVPSTIVVSPLADPSLRLLLGERGYTIAEFNSVLIRRIAGDEPLAPPPGVAVERVTPDTLGPWMSAICQGFAQDIAVVEDVFGGFAALPGALPFLARVDGAVAGGCGGRIIPEARIAALFGTATLPQFRRRGVQSALIARRIHEAAVCHCEYAVVSTQPGSGSQRNMERRGFHVAYTKPVMMREWKDAVASRKA